MDAYQPTSSEIPKLLSRLIHFIIIELTSNQKQIAHKTGISEATMTELKKADTMKHKSTYRKYFYKILDAFDLRIVAIEGVVSFEKINSSQVQYSGPSHSVIQKDGKFIFSQTYNPLIEKLIGSYIGYCQYNEGDIKNFAVNINKDFSIQFKGGGYREGFLIIQEPNLFFVLFGDKVADKHTSSEMLIAKIGRRLRSQEERIRDIPIAATWANEEGDVCQGVGVLWHLQDRVEDVREIDYCLFEMPETIKHFFEKTRLNKVTVLNHSSIFNI